MLLVETCHLVGRQSCANTTAGTNSAPPTVPCEWNAFLIGMIGDQTKILSGPGSLDGSTPGEVGIAPVGIVAQDQLLRSPCNRGLAWEPGQIGQHQLPPRFEPGFDQGNHALRIEIQPTLPTTDDIEGLWGQCRLFCGTGHKADIEVFLT